MGQVAASVVDYDRNFALEDGTCTRSGFGLAFSSSSCGRHNVLLITPKTGTCTHNGLSEIQPFLSTRACPLPEKKNWKAKSSTVENTQQEKKFEFAQRKSTLRERRSIKWTRMEEFPTRILPAG
ncbi:uncharacterized protein SPPG_09481 [Spizellomyces punctatus DAOM BR117]|uniref:Uncharacterized protein n=1 Tax=Spizellomyces punctatus (strain DAOM BR117) TaxID=645134 RepID=A0A0L0H6T2_SPIPD|nr:uncharacterized protein SPPG_09481 [Spizellomyces punctatus DAOM BR117]KNC97215.1 hypothetical protein SPPG_09481 [Spizellomyces punctatus DAOM BR117]|eukprot:XP_016605255.1 hypothetical protein SPPG_09481 [Spizellomyces punctatus DAOM BR117]